MLYEKEFVGKEFITEENECHSNDIHIPFLYKINYQQSFELEIDFSRINFRKGTLTIRMTEKRIVEDLVDGERVPREIKLYSLMHLYFKIEEDNVRFSNRQFD